MRGKRYIKIKWKYDDHEVPRIMQLDSCIDIDSDLKSILQGKSGNRILSIEEFTPIPKYLLLYITKMTNESDTPILILKLSDTINDEPDLFLIRSFGRHIEHTEVFDIVRVSGESSIIAQEPDKLTFQEHLIDCNRQFNSILTVISGIFECVDFNITESDRRESELQVMAESSKN